MVYILILSCDQNRSYHLHPDTTIHASIENLWRVNEKYAFLENFLKLLILTFVFEGLGSPIEIKKKINLFG